MIDMVGVIDRGEKKQYTIRYGVIDCNLIYNYVAPGYHVHTISEEEKIKLQNKYIENRNKRDNFYNILEKSILEYGIRNPIIVQVGFVSNTIWRNLPKVIQNKGMENLIICVNNGGSRLYVAQKYNMPIPCVFIDYVNRFNNFKILRSSYEIKSVFETPPNHIILKEGKPMFLMDVHKWKNLWITK